MSPRSAYSRRWSSRPVTEAACPFGSYDRCVLRSLRRHGYQRAYTSDPGTTRLHDWIQVAQHRSPRERHGTWSNTSRSGEVEPIDVLRRRAKRR